MKAITLIVPVLVTLIVLPQAMASEIWMLVQVNTAGQVLSNLGAFGSKEACMVELAKEKAQGLKGLECRPLSGGAPSQPSAPPSQASPEIVQDAIFGRLNLRMLDERGCPPRWNAAKTSWERLGDEECYAWRWLKEHAGAPGPWYLTTLSNTNTSSQLIGVTCVWRDRDGVCREFEREFLITKTYNYAILGTFDTAEKCVVARKARSWSGECTTTYVPVRYEQSRDWDRISP